MKRDNIQHSKWIHTRSGFLYLINGVFLLQSISFCARSQDTAFSNKPTANSVADKQINVKKFIIINGIEQWITIKGDDISRPVILFLHGGPGSSLTPYADAIYGQWAKEYVLVQWDQRGSGKTYGRNAPVELSADYLKSNPLTIEKITADGIEVAEYIIKHLGKQKIILLGTSWGSIIGVQMAVKRPDLFYAYIGHSQVVNPSQDLIYACRKVYKMAQEENDTVSTGRLDSIGLPPYEDPKNAGKLLRIIKKYERKNSTPGPASWLIISPEYDNEKDNRDRYDGDDYSFVNYVGYKRLGIKPMNTINLLANDLEFKIPVYLIQGAEDILTPKEITKEYFDKIKAPEKKFILIPKAAHGFNQAVVDMQFKVIKQYLLP
ncbi:MAG: alpha/beta hydrolase [Ginsengibacter sp.]